MQRFVDKVWVDDIRVYVSPGIHWPQIDEDLSFEGMFSAAGLCERTPTEEAVCYVG